MSERLLSQSDVSRLPVEIRRKGMTKRMGMDVLHDPGFIRETLDHRSHVAVIEWNAFERCEEERTGYRPFLSPSPEQIEKVLIDPERPILRAFSVPDVHLAAHPVDFLRLQVKDFGDTKPGVQHQPHHTKVSKAGRRFRIGLA